MASTLARMADSRDERRLLGPRGRPALPGRSDPKRVDVPSDWLVHGTAAGEEDEWVDATVEVGDRNVDVDVVRDKAISASLRNVTWL